MAQAKKTPAKAEKTEEITEEVRTSQVIDEEKKVTIMLPKIKGEDNDEGVLVFVNERNWLIKRGVPVEVPECVVSNLHNAELMEAEGEAFRKKYSSGK